MYVDEKFRKHIFSEDKLNTDLRNILEQFKSDLEASRNQLFSEFKLALRIADAPIKLDEEQFKAYTGDIEIRASRLSQEMAMDGAVLGVLPMIGGQIVGQIAETALMKILQGVFASALSSAAVTAVAEGGTLMATTTTGGGIGNALAGTPGKIV